MKTAVLMLDQYGAPGITELTESDESVFPLDRRHLCIGGYLLPNGSVNALSSQGFNLDPDACDTSSAKVFLGHKPCIPRKYVNLQLRTVAKKRRP
jgi:hypothetical protein